MPKRTVMDSSRSNCLIQRNLKRSGGHGRQPDHVASCTAVWRAKFKSGVPASPSPALNRDPAVPGRSQCAIDLGTGVALTSEPTFPGPNRHIARPRLPWDRRLGADVDPAADDVSSEWGRLPRRWTIRDSRAWGSHCGSRPTLGDLGVRSWAAL